MSILNIFRLIFIIWLLLAAAFIGYGAIICYKKDIIASAIMAACFIYHFHLIIEQTSKLCLKP